MKKLVLMFAVVAGMTLAACGSSTSEEPAATTDLEVVEEAVEDTTASDTTATDTTATETTEEEAPAAE